MKRYTIVAGLMSLVLIPATAQAKTVNVPPSACGGAFTPPCFLHVPTSRTIYSTTSPKPPNRGMQAWTFHAKKGQHYSIRVAYTGPATSGPVTLTVALTQTTGSHPWSRGALLCSGSSCPTGGSFEAFDSPGGNVKLVPVGSPLVGTFPASGQYAVGIAGVPDSVSAAVPYRLGLRVW